MCTDDMIVHLDPAKVNFGEVKEIGDGRWQASVRVDVSVTNCMGDPIIVTAIGLDAPGSKFFDNVPCDAPQRHELKPNASEHFEAEFPLKTKPLTPQEAEVLSGTPLHVLAQEDAMLKVQYDSLDRAAKTWACRAYIVLFKQPPPSAPAFSGPQKVI